MPVPPGPRTGWQPVLHSRIIDSGRNTRARAVRLPPAIPFRRGRRSRPGGSAGRNGRGFCPAGETSGTAARLETPRRSPPAGWPRRADRQGGEAGHEPPDPPVVRPGPLGKNHQHLAPLQPPQRFLHPAYADPLPVQGNRVQRVYQPTERGKVEQRLPGEKVHPPRNADAHQRRIEMALMVGNQQHASGQGDVLAAGEANPINQHRAHPQQIAEKIVPQAAGKGSLGHKGGNVESQMTKERRITNPK